MTGTPAAHHIAKRYAKALFDVVVAQNADPDMTEQELQAVVNCMVESPPFRTVCESPLLGVNEKIKAIDLIAQSSGLSAPLVRFLKVMAAHHRLALLTAVSEAYASICRSLRGEVEADITTAKALSAKDSKAIASALASAFGKTVMIKPAVDSRLLGGIKIRVGSRELDATVAGKLAKAAERLDSIISAA